VSHYNHMTSHDGSHDKCGKVVHRPCSSCISSVGNLIGTLCHMMENTHLNNIIFFYFILLLIFCS